LILAGCSANVQLYRLLVVDEIKGKIAVFIRDVIYVTGICEIFSKGF
jgi:hypothetical protein